ncbi:MAG: hypothetical protein ACREIW_08425 [Chthoniobacterales bacterium]
MKPTPQFSPQPNTRQRGLLTDYYYQFEPHSSRAGVRKFRAPRDVGGFWKLSAGFFGVEARIDYALELALFSVITALSAWPVIAAFQALSRLARNY